MDDMTTRISSLRSVLPTLESALHSFTSSPSKFRIVRTVNPTSTEPKTLYILDSSFNPPSRAHFELATSALKEGTGEKPHRLLLLFSTHNADKAPSPASFAQRIALMTVFAEDLSQSLKSESAAKNVSIDIGLTKEPYYTDKSIAIAETTPPAYPTSPTHVHLIGYDTLTRFCNPKYYTTFSPPLSALTPFFSAGHRLRVTLRPSDAGDESSKAFGEVEEQKQYLKGLREGAAEKEGFRREWGDAIELVGGKDGVGISSTRVRKAAGKGEWEEVGRLCTEGVAGWVRDQRLYEEDSSGKKMMD
jgi:nicotinamide-nucleotide adenylyltransferase